MKRLAVALLPILLLAACGGQPRATAPTTTSEPARSPSVPPRAEQEPPPAVPAPQLASNPGLLKGMSDADLRDKLGPPSFLRREPPAQVWQYFGQGCVLDLFLYDEGKLFRVAHWQARGMKTGQKASESCLADLLNGTRGKRVG